MIKKLNKCYFHRFKLKMEKEWWKVKWELIKNNYMGFLRIILQGEPKENVVMGIEDQKWINMCLLIWLLWLRVISKSIENLCSKYTICVNIQCLLIIYVFIKIEQESKSETFPKLNKDIPGFFRPDNSKYIHIWQYNISYPSIFIL